LRYEGTIPIPTLGQISLDFATRRAVYPTYNWLPKLIGDDMDALNVGNTGPRLPPNDPRHAISGAKTQALAKQAAK
jgi:hypothetical protein